MTTVTVSFSRALIAAGLPIMEAQGGGQFINTASIGAHVVVPTAAVYCATKYAVWAVSEGLRQEPQNIRVTTISLGVVATELGHDITEESAKEALQKFRKVSLTSDEIAYCPPTLFYLKAISAKLTLR